MQKSTSNSGEIAKKIAKKMGEAPWTKIPYDLLTHSKREFSHLIVYGFIDFHAGKRGYWHDTQATIAEETQLSREQVNRSLRWLHKEHYIDSESAGPKYNNCRIYYILARSAPAPLDGDDDRGEGVTHTSQGCDPHITGGVTHTSQGVCSTGHSHSYPQIPTTDHTTDLSLAPDPKNAGKAEDKAAKRPQESNLKSQEASAMQPSEQLSPEQRAIWDELALKFGQPRTPRELTARRFCVGQLHKAKATPSQIRQAYRKWGEKYPKAGCTPHALVDHWGELLHNMTDLTRYQAPPVDAEREKEAIRTQTKEDYSTEDKAAFERFLARKQAKRAAKAHEGAFEA